jgi:23S rRNA G2445 N2-methylase RlmL
MVELRGNARALRRREAPRIFGSDASPEAVEAARASARRAQVDLELSLCALCDFELPNTPGTLVTNPPYGHRIERNAALPRELSQLIDAHPDWRAALLLAEDDQATRTHRRPDQVRQVFNGDIDCVVRTYAATAQSGV